MSAYLNLNTIKLEEGTSAVSAVKELCYANYCHPVFWMMLFEEGSDVTLIEEPVDSGQLYVLHEQGPMTETEARERGLWEGDGREPEEYPGLRTRSAEGIERARKRWPEVAGVIGERYAALFDTWITYIERHALDYIQLDPLEYWAISGDSEEYLEPVKIALRAFGTPATRREGLLFKKSVMAPEWIELLNIAQIRDAAREKGQLADRELCGFGSQKDTPWRYEEWSDQDG